MLINLDNGIIKKNEAGGLILKHHKLWILAALCSLFFALFFLFLVFSGFLFLPDASDPLATVEKFQEPDSEWFRTYLQAHRITIISRTDKQKIFSQTPGEYWIFFYREDCPFCEDIEPSIRWIIKNTDIPVFFVDTGLAVDDIFAEEAGWGSNASSWKLKGTPSLAVIKNGKGQELLSGSEDIAEYILEKGDIY